MNVATVTGRKQRDDFVQRSLNGDTLKRDGSRGADEPAMGGPSLLIGQGLQWLVYGGGARITDLTSALERRSPVSAMAR